MSGCADSKPAIAPLTVTLKTPNGQPLFNVLVRVVPQTKGLDGNAIGTGTTDKNGVCKIKLPGKTELGCYVGESKVQLSEGPEPNEARESYLEDQGAAINRFRASLKHRPLPKRYSLLVDTPLTVSVSADQPEVEFILE